MRLHAICVVKNEADVLAQTLRSAAAWCDRIYVLDTGSTDASWEIVLDLARSHSQIVPFRKSPITFTENIRRDVFMHYREYADFGDWWCRLDADEIYIDNPREFLTKVPTRFDLVWGALFQYHFTDEDLRRYETEPSRYGDDVPVSEKCRYYINDFSEPRFVRHHRGMLWRNADTNGWPSLVNHYPDGRIRIKHYQYRSPQQIQRRIATRWQAAVEGGCSFPHEVLSGFRETIVRGASISKAEADAWQRQAQVRASTHGAPPPDAWRQRVMPAADLVREGDTADYVMREDLMPTIPRSGVVKALARRVARRGLSPLANWRNGSPGGSA